VKLQLGNAIGFLLPPLIVRDSDVDTEIAKTLYYMFGAQAIICTIVLVLVIACKFLNFNKHFSKVDLKFLRHNLLLRRAKCKLKRKTFPQRVRWIFSIPFGAF